MICASLLVRAVKKWRRLSADIGGVALGPGETVRFSQGSLFVRAGENMRGRQVFLVQSTNYNLQ
jgi:phosphoribosylpyrophosphate synthetase